MEAKKDGSLHISSRKRIKKKYNHVLTPNYEEYTPTDLRHCIRGSYIAYEKFKEDAEIILNAKDGPAFRGEMAEQVLARRWLQDYPFIIKLMKEAALDQDGKFKSKWIQNNLDPGSLRSFVARVDNFRYSHNFNVLSKNDLKVLMGSEFK